MSDTTLAVAIVPFLVLLTLVLECTRMLCRWLQIRHRQLQAHRAAEPAVTSVHPAPGNHTAV